MANPWDKKYLYYTNEDLSHNSVMKIDTKSMTLKAEIRVTGINPHSVDRACNTDRMYVRTQSSYSFAVIDARTEKFIKNVALPFKPRTCGDQNYTHNLQLVSGTSDPGIALIDVADDDKVVFVDWEPKNGRSALGNQGGSATGHAVWFDDNHFGYLNRLTSKIKVFYVYKISGGGWSVYETQTVNTTTALHTIQDDKIDIKLKTKTLYGAVEGIKRTSTHAGQRPGIQKFIWENDKLKAITPYTQIPTPQNVDRECIDTVHHYSISPDGKYLWLPTFYTRRTHVLRLSDLKWVGNHQSGYGGGHVNFSPIHNGLVIITNHFDRYISLIYVTSSGHGSKWRDVYINRDEAGYPPKVGLLQTHSNWVSEDGKYFYIGNSHSGEIVEVRLDHGWLRRTLYVGGHPEQSIS